MQYIYHLATADFQSADKTTPKSTSNFFSAALGVFTIAQLIRVPNQNYPLRRALGENTKRGK